ncbi:MAG: thioredoxin family protein [Cytophagaceae bacterium]
MKKIIPPLLGISILFLGSCVSRVETTEQPYGKIDISEYEEQNWFLRGYKEYRPDKAELRALKEFPKDASILLFGAMWDTETKKSLPRIYKIIDRAGIPDNSINVYFLNKNLKSNEGMERIYDIKTVPTLIFIKDGKEVARIERCCKGLVETDMARIVPKLLMMDFDKAEE